MGNAKRHSTRPQGQVYNPAAPRIGSGVYDIDDLKERCEVDEDTGCWIWRLALSCNKDSGDACEPRVFMPAGVMQARRTIMSGPRASWLLSGRKIKAGQLVWRTCMNNACLAPDHLQAGTKKQWGRWVAKLGVLRGNPDMVLANTRKGVQQAVPKEQVREIEARLAAGEKQVKVAKDTHIHVTTIARIKHGRHCHQRPMRGASVFHQVA